MCFNAGVADRVVRVIAGLALVGYGVISENYIVAAVGVIPIITGAVGFCPAYPIFKINTGCKRD